MRIRTCETPIRISSSVDVVLARQRHQALRPPADERDARDDEDQQHPDDPAADELAQGEAGDHEDESQGHAGRPPGAAAAGAGSGSSSRTMPRNRSSRLRRPGSTAWTRPPRPTTAATASGTRSGSIGWIVSQSSSWASAPKAARAASTAPSPGRPVTRIRTRRLAEQLAERAGGDDPPVVDDRDPVAQPLDLAQQVRVEEHGRAPVARLADDRPHVVAADRVERGRGLVEDHERRVAHERRREPEPLLHALREAASAVAGAVGEPGEPEDALDLRPDGPWHGSPAELRVQRQHLVRGQPGLVAEQLGQVADPPPRLAVADAAGRGPGRSPAVGRVSPSRSLTAVVLPAPLGPRKPNTSPALDAEVEGVEADGPAVDLAQAVGLDGGAVMRAFSGLGRDSCGAVVTALGVTGRSDDA